MFVRNDCDFDIIAFCWDDRYGFGEDVLIKSGDFAEVPGPNDAFMSDPTYRKVMGMDIRCHESPDTNYYYHVSKGHQLCLGYGPCGITIRHHEEERQIQDAVTHCGNEFQIDTKGCEKFGFTSGERVWVVKNKTYAIVRGTSKKPPGMKACCDDVGPEVLWIQVEGENHLSVIFHPDLSIKKINTDKPPSD